MNAMFSPFKKVKTAGNYFLNPPVLYDGMGDRTLRNDVGRQSQALHVRKSGAGPKEEEGGEALEVVVGGGDGNGQAGHAADEAVEVLSVGAELAQELEGGGKLQLE